MNVNTYRQDEEKTRFSFSNFIRMLEFVKPYQKQLIISFLIGIFSNILLLLLPKIMEYAIDVSFIQKDFIQIVYLTIGMLVIIIIATWLTKIKRDKLLIVLDKVARDIKIAIFTKLQYLPNTYFDTRSHGKIYTRAATYPDEVASTFCYGLVQTLLDIINLFFVILFMVTTNWKLSLISISLSLVLIIVFIVLSPIRRRLQHIANDKTSNVNAYISESINGIRITQSFNREKKNEKILQDLEKKRILANKKVWYISNLNWALSGVFNTISMVIIFYVALKYMYPAISIGAIMAINSYSSRFWEPIEYLTSTYNEFMDASTYLERIFELLDEDLVINNSQSAKNIEIEGKIEFNNVSFSYDEKNPVLEGFSMRVEKGEKVGLVGETGCGKSTVLSLISRFYDVTKGQILIDDVDIRNIKLSSLRGQVSMMLQDNFLFSRSVMENLTLGKNISLEKVEEICKKLEIHDFILSLENGYDTILRNNASNLSSGERQLLCIARIMIQDPKILILDEATSNIDLKTEKRITHALKLVSEKRTTIIVAHRITTIKNCDKIIFIKNHQNKEEGTHEELMKRKGEYYRLYTHQGFEK